jgi:predicted O-methyltransferase YrrM
MMNFLKNKKLIGLEIGVEYGLNAKTMLKLLPIEKLYLVDPYSSSDEIFTEVKKYLAKYGNKITFIRKTSEKAVEDIPDNLDFVYIDGSHSYESVTRDIKLFYNKIKKGGIIGGHDFWANEIGVCKAVLEFAEINNLKLNGNLTDWWIVNE